LRHSMVVGSIMYDVSARNGPFGDNGSAFGRLAADDISAVRDLYGSKADPGCCSVLAGRVVGANRNTQTIVVWLRDPGTGAVIAHSGAGKDGVFRIGGLGQGTYDVMARENSYSTDYSVFRLGQISIENRESLMTTFRLVRKPREFSVSLVGRNGILSEAPLKLLRGIPNTIYLGGEGLASRRLHIETDSPFLSVDKDSLTFLEYDGGISALGAVVTVKADTPPGSYSVCAVSDTGSRDCVIGGLSVFD
jgi:hypothetical protein